MFIACFSFYFIVAMVVEIFTFKKYMNCEEDMTNDVLVAKQMKIWSWPVYVVWIVFKRIGAVFVHYVMPE